MNKVDFATHTYAPILVLGEDLNAGYWPIDVYTFMEHCDFVSSGNVNNPNEVKLTSKVRLSYPSEILDWFRGTRPTHGLKDHQRDLVRDILGRISSNPVALLDGSYPVPVYTFQYPGTFNPKDHTYHWDEAGFERGQFVVFYYFFFGYNFGKHVKVLKKVLGNHVGDWEFVAVSFENFSPAYCIFKPHSFGTAVVKFPEPSLDEAVALSECRMPTSNRYLEDGSEPTYFPLEDSNLRFYCRRPVVYCALGTHAMWPTSGRHKYAPSTTPDFIAKDIADACGDSAASTTIWFLERANLEIIPPSVWRGLADPAPPRNHESPTIHWITDVAQWGNDGMPATGLAKLASFFADQEELCGGPRGFSDRIPFAEVMRKTPRRTASTSGATTT